MAINLKSMTKPPVTVEEAVERVMVILDDMTDCADYRKIVESID